MYFNITPYLKFINDKNLMYLNELIIKLSENINQKNYYDIIIFYKKITSI